MGLSDADPIVAVLAFVVVPPMPSRHRGFARNPLQSLEDLARSRETMGALTMPSAISAALREKRWILRFSGLSRRHGMKAPWVSVLLLILCSTTVLGLGGKLSAPSLGYRSDLDASRMDEIQKVLQFMKDDLSFIEGRFINQFSNQRFGGTSAQVSRSIGQLKGVGVWEVDVHFRDFGEQESAFSLDQDSSKDHLRLIINSGRSDFLLKDFAPYLPSPRLPRSDQSKGEPDGAPGGRQPRGTQTNRTPSVDVPGR